MTMPTVPVQPFPGRLAQRRYERLPAAECLRRLQPGGVGRLAFADGPMPVIVPVNFGMLRDEPVLRTAPGTVIDGLRDGDGVALEVDQIDLTTGLAWSVLLRGRVRHVIDPEELAACQALGVAALAPGRRTRWLLVEPARLTGRIIL